MRKKCNESYLNINYKDKIDQKYINYFSSDLYYRLNYCSKTNLSCEHEGLLKWSIQESDSARTRYSWLYLLPLHLHLHLNGYLGSSES